MFLKQNNHFKVLYSLAFVSLVAVTVYQLKNYKFAARKPFSVDEVKEYQQRASSGSNELVSLLAKNVFNSQVSGSVANFMARNNTEGRVENWDGIVTSAKTTLVKRQADTLKRIITTRMDNPVTRFLKTQRISQSLNLPELVTNVTEKLHIKELFGGKSETKKETQLDFALSQPLKGMGNLFQGFSAGSLPQIPFKQSNKVETPSIEVVKKQEAERFDDYLVDLDIAGDEIKEILHLKEFPFINYNLDMTFSDGLLFNYLKGEATAEQYIYSNNLRVLEANGLLEINYNVTLDEIILKNYRYNIRFGKATSFLRYDAEGTLIEYGVQGGWSSKLTTSHSYLPADEKLSNNILMRPYGLWFDSLQTQLATYLNKEKVANYDVKFTLKKGF